LILEWVLDYDYVLADEQHCIVLDDRLPALAPPDDAWLHDPVNVAAFLRIGLKRYLGHKHTLGRRVLEVLLVGTDVQRVLNEYRMGESWTGEAQILEAVRAEADKLDPSITSPAVLTTTQARAALRQIIAQEFRWLPVMAYQEIAPELNIQPISRISLITAKT
jgi:type III secretion protein V